MVAHPRTPLGTRPLRALNQPALLEVQMSASGQPLAVQRSDWRNPRSVAEVQDRWRIDDEWWREQSISRLYHLIRLADDQLLTIYQDLLSHQWFEQRG
jgi:hypothetical protein